MAATYDSIASTTLGSNTTTVTFSSISGSYTDLILVATPAAVDANFNALAIRFNSDTGTNYSLTQLNGNGSSASTSRDTDTTKLYVTQSALTSTVGECYSIVHIMNYSNTTTYKSILTRGSRGTSTNGLADLAVGLYRSTSAITSINIETSAGSINQLKSGSIFSLYGIKAK